MMTRKDFLIGAAATAATASAIDGECIEGAWGRARGLTGGAFMGTLLAQQGGEPKPYLREVAYLESTGTQYIDCGFSPSSSDGNLFELDAQYVGDNVVGCLYGAVERSRYFYQINKNTVGNVYRIITYNGDTDYVYSAAVSGMHKYAIAGNVLSIDGQYVKTGKLQGDINSRLILFARSVDNTINQFGKWRIRSCKYTRNGNVILDAIAVLDNNAKPAMYDRASKSFLYNKASGDDFVWAEL